MKNDKKTELIIAIILTLLAMIIATVALISHYNSKKENKHIDIFEHPVYVSVTSEDDYEPDPVALSAMDISQLSCVDEAKPISNDIPLDGWLQLEIQYICDRYYMSYPLVLAVIEHECTFKVDCDWSGNIVGPMQVNKNYHGARAEQLGVDIMTIEGNIETGVSLLSDLCAKHEGEPKDALMAYNGGKNKEKYADYVMKRAEYWQTVVDAAMEEE